VRRIDQIALAVAVVLLALGPLALTLARADSYRSTAVISLNPDNPGARYLPNPGKFLSDPLKVKDLQRQVAKDVDWFNTPRDLPDHVRVVDQGNRSFGVSAEGPGADEAQALATSAARRLRDAAEAGAAFTQPLQLKTIDTALKKKDLPAEFRTELRKRRAAIATSIREHEDIYGPAPASATRPTERVGDRLLSALPGKRSFRPNPAWAAFAGIALAAALALWALVLTGRRPEGSGTTPG
jgi:hypothetical protein